MAVVLELRPVDRHLDTHFARQKCWAERCGRRGSIGERRMEGRPRFRALSATDSCWGPIRRTIVEGEPRVPAGENSLRFPIHRRCGCLNKKSGWMQYST